MSDAYSGAGRGSAAAARGGGESELPNATGEDLRLVRTVCQIVARQFYQDQHVIMIDILSRHSVLPADILAGCLGVPIKDLLQIANMLVRDRLIGIRKRNEVREQPTATSVITRNATRNYFYLDRKTFLDVTKWRMMKMRLQIDSILRNELDNKGYMCPRCGKSYSTLDVAALLDPMTNAMFICDVPGCGSELVDNEDAEDVRRSKDRLKRFNEQFGPILDRLRKIDTVTLPSFDVDREINKNGDSDAWKLRARQRLDPNATMKDIKDAQVGAQNTSGSMEITMVSNDPVLEAARRAEREREAERQLQENALPAWWRTTQDPNTRLAGSTGASADQARRQANNDAPENGSANGAQDADDYYAQYASMAQDGLDDEDGLELENVDDESATPSAGPSLSHTPATAGKRSREDSPADRATGKKAKAEIRSGPAVDDDEEELEFEDVA